jgi:hypothetical protein
MPSRGYPSTVLELFIKDLSRVFATISERFTDVRQDFATGNLEFRAEMDYTL